MIQAIIGIIFIFFLPGFLFALLFLEDFKLYEKLFLGVILSISFYILLGLFLGFNLTMKTFTGGLTEFNLWIYSLVFCFMMSGAYIFKRIKRNPIIEPYKRRKK
jgi:uncharacterized membrane protein